MNGLRNGGWNENIYGISHHHFSERHPIDIDAFAERIIFLLQDEIMRSYIANNSLDNAEYYNWSHIVGYYLDYWTHLCEQKQDYKEPNIPKFADVFSHYPNQ